MGTTAATSTAAGFSDLVLRCESCVEDDDAMMLLNNLYKEGCFVLCGLLGDSVTGGESGDDGIEVDSIGDDDVKDSGEVGAETNSSGVSGVASVVAGEVVDSSHIDDEGKAVML